MVISRLGLLVEKAPGAISQDPMEPGITRGEQLRRKYAQKILEVTVVGLRTPAESEVAALEASISPARLPKSIRSVYSVCDGECTSGFFAPSLEFLRCSYVAKWKAGNREAVVAGAIPDVVAAMLPIMRDVVGNQLLLPLREEHEQIDTPVFYLNLESFSIRMVSSGVQFLFRRLLDMREANLSSGFVSCSGDFRALTAKETEIAKSIEPSEGPDLSSACDLEFEMSSPADMGRLRSFLRSIGELPSLP